MVARLLKELRFLSIWKRFDRRGWITRIAIALAIAIATLALIDRASLLIAPCDAGYGYSDQKNSTDGDCVTRKGIVVAGLEWLNERAPDSLDTLTALGTIAVAAFTGALWLSSEKLWRITRVSTIATRHAANAAKKSADVAEAALTVAQRPYLVPKEPKLKMSRTGTPGMPTTMTNPAVSCEK